MRLLKFTRFSAAVVIIYLLMSFYAAYYLFQDYKEDVNGINEHRPTSPRPFIVPEAAENGSKLKDWHFSQNDLRQLDPPDTEVDVKHTVEIWGKAAIGLYLWLHIFGADIVPKMNGVWSYGSSQVNDILFQFRTGPGVVPDKAPSDVENLVLILNGREPSKIEVSKMWLDYLPQYKKLVNVAVMLLGNEECDNEWLKPYLVANGGRVHFVFVVYDSPDIDDVTFYQWPLGVATYREFPVVDLSSVNTQKQRFFTCNFLGTVYPNSSRADLLKYLNKPELYNKCYVKPRMHWWPKETPESQMEYIHALQNSDLTLSPVGKNTESYRIYEAMSYGSVPIIEDIITRGHCSNSSEGPLRLLKQYKAPLTYIKDWTQLTALIDKDSALPQDSVVRRRQGVIEWYIYFKGKMKDKFVGVIKERFFES